MNIPLLMLNWLTNWNCRISFKLAYINLNLFQSLLIYLMVTYNLCAHCFLVLLFGSRVSFSVTFLPISCKFTLLSGSIKLPTILNIQVVIMIRKQEQRLSKFKSIISVVDTLWKNIFMSRSFQLFSCPDLLVFSVYLNINKKKQFFQIQMLLTSKINPREITKIWPSGKINPRKKS